MSQFDRGYYTGGLLAALLASAFALSSCCSQTEKEQALVIREARALIHHYHVSGEPSWDARVLQFEDDAARFVKPSPLPATAPKSE